MERPKQRIKLGELLMGAGMITSAQLEELLAEQGKSRKRLVNILIERNITHNLERPDNRNAAIKENPHTRTFFK